MESCSGSIFGCEERYNEEFYQKIDSSSAWSCYDLCGQLSGDARRLAYQDKRRSRAEEYYLDIDGKIKIADDVKPLTADAVQDGFGYPGTTSWYIVEGELTLDDRLSVFGNVNLILADGADLTINGIYRGLFFAQSYFSEPLTLTIYAQSYESNMGKMTATSPFDGVTYSEGGTIVVNGGDVTLLGGTQGYKAGIAFSGSGNLIVNGGKFKAVSKDESSGCGIHYTENCSVTLGCSFPTDSIKIANFSAYEDGQGRSDPDRRYKHLQRRTDRNTVADTVRKDPCAI